MKKIIYTVLFVMLMTIFPMISKAEEYKQIKLEEYNTMNLIKTLESEKIEVKYDDYKETDDQVTIYLFRGTGCAYCRGFLTFLSNLEAEYYNKIKLVSFDAWYDEESSILLGEISTFLGEEAGGVPYIIIGEEVFPGYASDYDEGIKAAIDNEYKKADKYDVINEFNNHIIKLEKAEKQEKMMPILWNGLITVICTVVIILYVNYYNSKLLYLLRGEETAYRSSYDEDAEDETTYRSSYDDAEEKVEEETTEDEVEEETTEDEVEETEEIVEEVAKEKKHKNNNTNKKNKRNVNKTNKKMN